MPFKRIHGLSSIALLFYLFISPAVAVQAVAGSSVPDDLRLFSPLAYAEFDVHGYRFYLWSSDAPPNWARPSQGGKPGVVFGFMRKTPYQISTPSGNAVCLKSFVSEDIVASLKLVKTIADAQFSIELIKQKSGQQPNFEFSNQVQRLADFYSELLSQGNKRQVWQIPDPGVRSVRYTSIEEALEAQRRAVADYTRVNPPAELVSVQVDPAKGQYRTYQRSLESGVLDELGYDFACVNPVGIDQFKEIYTARQAAHADSQRSEVSSSLKSSALSHTEYLSFGQWRDRAIRELRIELFYLRDQISKATARGSKYWIDYASTSKEKYQRDERNIRLFIRLLEFGEGDAGLAYVHSVLRQTVSFKGTPSQEDRDRLAAVVARRASDAGIYEYRELSCLLFESNQVLNHGYSGYFVDKLTGGCANPVVSALLLEYRDRKEAPEKTVSVPYSDHEFSNLLFTMAHAAETDFEKSIPLNNPVAKPSAYGNLELLSVSFDVYSRLALKYGASQPDLVMQLSLDEDMRQGIRLISRCMNERGSLPALFDAVKDASFKTRKPFAVTKGRVNVKTGIQRPDTVVSDPAEVSRLELSGSSEVTSVSVPLSERLALDCLWDPDVYVLTFDQGGQPSRLAEERKELENALQALRATNGQGRRVLKGFVSKGLPGAIDVYDRKNLETLSRITIWNYIRLTYALETNPFSLGPILALSPDMIHTFDGEVNELRVSQRGKFGQLLNKEKPLRSDMNLEQKYVVSHLFLESFLNRRGKILKLSNLVSTPSGQWQFAKVCTVGVIRSLATPQTLAFMAAFAGFHTVLGVTGRASPGAKVASVAIGGVVDLGAAVFFTYHATEMLLDDYSKLDLDGAIANSCAVGVMYVFGGFGAFKGGKDLMSAHQLNKQRVAALKDPPELGVQEPPALSESVSNVPTVREAVGRLRQSNSDSAASGLFARFGFSESAAFLRTKTSLNQRLLEVLEGSRDLMAKLEAFLEKFDALPGSKHAKDIALQQFLTVLSRQERDNILKYVSHGADHSLRVMDWSLRINEALPEVRQSIQRKYGLTPDQADAATMLVGLLHDIGYTGIRSGDAKWLHADAGAQMFREVMRDEQVASMFGKKSLSRDLLIEDIAKAIEEHNHDVSGSKQETATFRCSCSAHFKTATRALAEAHFESNPLLFNVRFADNLDFTFGRLAGFQKAEWFMKALHDLHTDQKIAELTAKGKKATPEERQQLKKRIRFVVDRSLSKWAGRVSEAELQAAKGPLYDSNAESFLHFYSNWAIEGARLTKRVNPVDGRLQFVLQVQLRDPPSSFQTAPGSYFFQIARMYESFETVIFGRGQKVSDMILIETEFGGQRVSEPLSAFRDPQGLGKFDDVYQNSLGVR